MSKKERLLSFLLIICAVSAVYYPALESPFQFDDEAGIILNPDIQDIKNIKAVLSCKPELPRPLFNLSLALDFHFWRFNPFGYHLTGLLLHIIVTLLVWRLSATIAYLVNGKRDFIPALLSALIFGLHPLASETVIYIWSRSSLMMALFVALSVWLFLKYWSGSRRNITLVFAWLSFVCAVLSKEEALTLPILLLALDRIVLPPEGRRRRLWYHLPFWVVPLFAVVYRVMMNFPMYDVISWRGSQADEFAEQVIKYGVIGMIPWNFVTQVKTGFFYALMMLFPIWQSVDHGISLEVPPFSFLGYIGFIFTILCVSLYVVGGKRFPRLSVAVVFFFVPLSLFYFFPVSDIMVERRLYLPIFGWAFLLADKLSFLVVKAREKGNFIRCSLLFCALPILCFSIQTFHRSKLWNDKILLWSDAVRVSSQKIRPRVVLARYFYEKGGIYRAIHENEYAIKIKENYNPAIVNIGLIYLDMGELDTAESYFRQAIHWHPSSDFNARFNLAVALQKKGKLKEAVEQYRETLKINPSHASARHALGGLLIQMGRLEEGIDELEKAVKSAPTNGRFWSALGFAYLKAGKIEQAGYAFNKALVDPDSPEAYYGLAEVELSTGKNFSALAHFRQFIQATDLKKRPELAPLVERASSLVSQ